MRVARYRRSFSHILQKQKEMVFLFSDYQECFIVLEYKDFTVLYYENCQESKVMVFGSDSLERFEKELFSLQKFAPFA